MNDNIILFIQTQQYYITSSSSTVPGSNVSRPQQSHPVLSSNRVHNDRVGLGLEEVEDFNGAGALHNGNCNFFPVDKVCFSNFNLFPFYIST